MISTIVLLGLLQILIFFIALRYFGPLPRNSTIRFMAGLIAFVSVPLIVLTQVRVETWFRVHNGYNGPRLASKAIVIEGAICLCLVLYFTYFQRRRG